MLFRSNDTATTEIYTVTNTLSLHDALPIFLNLIGALDGPDAGRIAVDGAAVGGDGDSYRAQTVGFVFQFHNLIPVLSAAENVQVPMMGRGLSRHERARRADDLLGEVGLAERAGAFPPTLSGGERQRVAIARALANDPRLLLADEPTGALDSVSGEQVVALLRRLCETRGMTILLVTNDRSVAARADRIVELRDGRLLAAEGLDRREAGGADSRVDRADQADA